MNAHTHITTVIIWNHILVTHLVLSTKANTNSGRIISNRKIVLVMITPTTTLTSTCAHWITGADVENFPPIETKLLCAWTVKALSLLLIQ